MPKKPKKKKKSNRLALKEVIYLCDVLMSEDSVSETVELNILQERPVTEKERAMAQLISKLYRILHPYCGCYAPHKGWLKESFDEFQPIKKNIRIAKSKEALNNLKS